MIENRREVSPNLGSFRDPANKVYETSNSILRGVNSEVLDNFNNLSDTEFFKEFLKKQFVVHTEVCSPESNESAKKVISEGWAGVLEHEVVPFISYPYEWSFSMLKDAALMHLFLVEKSLENGWTLKDATPFNIQWFGAFPRFIDIPSFEPNVEGEPWVGYRQFCSMFLTPLMLKTHLGIDYLPLIRSHIDGIPPMEAVKYFNGTSFLKKGVLSHIALPSYVENKISKKERDRASAKERKGKQSKAMVLGLVDSMWRLVNKLKTNISHTDWSQYAKNHSYDGDSFEEKLSFVRKNTSEKHRKLTWDIGCNTGTFSKVASEFSDYVVAIDGDHDAIEQLYLSEKADGNGKILPLVMNLANISPNQGWAGSERVAFDQRRKPDLIICLALIHHMRLSANIPIEKFVSWLHSLEGDLILEFVTRKDDMVEKLLTNKKEQYEDYNQENFEKIVKSYFEIRDRKKLKNGKREIFYLSPIKNQ